MNQNTKRLFSLFLALVLLCGALAGPASAATQQGTAAANELYRLGLFKGAGTLPDGSPDFDLDGYANRAQAVVMLVRLLGGEEEALDRHYSHPFTDAGWAGDYLGYAYQNKMVNGRSDTFFDSDSRVSAADFLTMLLRAMGYSQVDWQDPYPTARVVGMDWSGERDFRRGDMAYICQSALSCRPSGSSQTLYQSLEAQGALRPTEPVQPPAAGFTPGPVTSTAVGTYTVTSGEDALAKLMDAINCRAATIVLAGPVGLMDACGEAVERAFAYCSDVNGYGASVSYNFRDMTMTVRPTYTDAVEIMAYLEGKRSGLSDVNAKTLEKAKQVHDSLVTPQMSEYDRVKAFHDYLVNNTTYQDGTYSHDAAGPLLYGQAVCDGYANALDLLCYLSGIECTRITGWADGDHAWNKVKVNGSWYNIDVTWDDPLTNYGPVLRYDYFLISDGAIARDHSPDNNPYWPAAPASWTGNR